MAIVRALSLNQSEQAGLCFDLKGQHSHSGLKQHERTCGSVERWDDGDPLGHSGTKADGGFIILSWAVST